MTNIGASFYLRQPLALGNVLGEAMRLYNERPTWLRNIHWRLDEAVGGAYGWPADLADEEVLKRLLELNLRQAYADQSR